MRIAANDVERLLTAAAEEAKHVAPADRPARTDELTEAFRREMELRRRPFGRAIVRGRKDRVPREVVTTGETNGLYRRCLVPYSAAQEQNRRRTEATFSFRRGGKGRWFKGVPPRSSAKEREEDRLEVRALMPYHFHDCFILESRLERQS